MRMVLQYGLLLLIGVAFTYYPRVIDASTKTRSLVVQEATGKSLFVKHCVACYGADGTAGIARATNLQTSRIDSAAVIKIIKSGKKIMPSFFRKLNDEQINKMTSYVMVLRK